MEKVLFESMAQSIIDGDVGAAADLARQAVAEDVDPLEAVNSGYVVGITQVGVNYSCGDAFVPDLVVAGAAMEAAMAVLEPELVKKSSKREELGVIVLATVKGDIHDIGKNIVGMMLSASGFTVHDLGADVPTEQIVAKVRGVDADIVAVSALLTTTMTEQERVVQTLQEAGLRDTVKVIVGGAPVTQQWVEAIGADGFSEDAVGAVAVAKEVLTKRSSEQPA